MSPVFFAAVLGLGLMVMTAVLHGTAQRSKVRSEAQRRDMLGKGMK